MLRLDPFQITVGGFFYFIFFAGRVTSFGHSPWSYNVKFPFFFIPPRALYDALSGEDVDVGRPRQIRALASMIGTCKNYWFLAQGYVVFKKCFCFSSRDRRHFKVRCGIFTTLGSANRRSPNRLLKRGTKAIKMVKNFDNHFQDIHLLNTPLHCIITK